MQRMEESQVISGYVNASQNRILCNGTSMFYKEEALATTSRTMVPTSYNV